MMGGKHYLGVIPDNVDIIPIGVGFSEDGFKIALAEFPLGFTSLRASVFQHFNQAVHGINPLDLVKAQKIGQGQGDIPQDEKAQDGEGVSYHVISPHYGAKASKGD